MITLSKNAGRLYILSSFKHGGRRAGTGMSYDDYGEDSMGGCGTDDGRVKVNLPHDGVPFEDLNGPVRIIQPPKNKLQKE